MSVRKSVRTKEDNKMSTMNKMILVIGLTIVFVYAMICVKDFMIGFAYGYNMAIADYENGYCLYENEVDEIEVNEIVVKPIEVKEIEVRTIGLNDEDLVNYWK